MIPGDSDPKFLSNCDRNTESALSVCSDSTYYYVFVLKYMSTLHALTKVLAMQSAYTNVNMSYIDNAYPHSSMRRNVVSAILAK